MFSLIILVPYIEKSTNARKDYENWLRLVALVDSVGKRLCYEILHSKEKLPNDGAQLYWKLQSYKSDIHFEIHEEILCPSNGIIDESKFDLLTYITVIILMFGDRYKDFLQHVTARRNRIFHLKDVSVCTRKFEQIWSGTCVIFDKLCKDDFDITLPNDLKTCNLFSVEVGKGIEDFFIVLIKF